MELLMRGLVLLGLLLSSLAWFAGPAAAADEPPAPLGTRIADFTVTVAATGRPWSLATDARDARAAVVVFLSTGCPVSNAYLPRLADLHRQYSGKGVVFVGINSHSTDDAQAVAAHARDHALPFVVTKDDGTRLADRFQVDRIPTAYVLDGGRTVRYMGRIDDQFRPGVMGAKATTHELAAALDAVLAGQSVPVASAPAAGCRLTRDEKVKGPATEPITYTRHVSRIVQANCQGCHRPGEIGPFSLTTYKQTRGWADMIAEVVQEGRMPPWHVDAPPGHFRNDRRLSAGDKKTLLAWVDQGCPEGDPKDLPPARTFAAGWAGSKPDRVLTMRTAVEVPAQAPPGGVPYQYVLVGEPFAEDTWVRGIEIRPGDRRVVHHAILAYLPPGLKMDPDKPLLEQAHLLEVADTRAALGDLIRGRKELNHVSRGYLTAYVPGDLPVVLPDGFAKKIPKDARLYLQLHYTPYGKATSDRTAVGLTLAAGPNLREVKTATVMTKKFAIPPGAADYPVTATLGLDRSITVLSYNPHMHLRGKAFAYRAVMGEGQSEVLLSVPRYDFNWQQTYTLAQPRRLTKGTSLECVARFDNSPANPSNPDPSQTVHFGEQTWHEMVIGFLDYYEN
jgi:hypothetical protein